MFHPLKLGSHRFIPRDI